MPIHVSEIEFGRLVEQAMAELPADFAKFVEEVPIEVRDRPTAAQLRSVGVGSNSLLLGLYVGRPRTRRHVEDSGAMPDVIFLFQSSIEQISNSPEELVRQVRKTLLHEIGHHFGLNERELTELGYG